MVLPPVITPDFFVDVCRRNGIVLDTNMLLLYFVGVATEGRLKSCPRIKEYTNDDFEYLAALVKESKGDKLMVSPHSVTEVLYLMGIDPRKDGREFGTDTLVERIKNLFDVTLMLLDEAEESIYTDTPSIVKENKKWNIKKFGMPDLSFKKSLLENGYAFLSSDGIYVSHLYENGICAASLDMLRSIKY